MHYGSPDKRPAVRLETIRLAGELRVPFTTGILSASARPAPNAWTRCRRSPRCNAEHGHIQEVIVQNFRAKPGTKRADAAEPDLDDLLWTIAAARLILGPAMNIQRRRTCRQVCTSAWSTPGSTIGAASRRSRPTT